MTVKNNYTVMIKNIMKIQPTGYTRYEQEKSSYCLNISISVFLNQSFKYLDKE